jgi:protoporphyrinogen/coproporphyrinogen III oxidase
MIADQHTGRLMADAKRVAIVGGGITGLAAAYRLRQRGSTASITLLESTDRLGGKIVTDRVDGFVIEGGPDAFLSYKPRGLGLCRDLGLEARLQGTNEETRRTYVMRNARLHVMPEGLTGLVPSHIGPMITSNLVSPLGKLRMGMEYFIPPRVGDDDETLAAFVQRRLGREVYDRMIEPLLSGIYAGDGAALSLRATFPQLRQAEVEHGGLIRGMLAKKRGPAPGDRQARRKAASQTQCPPFLTPTTGLAEIIEALEAHLGDIDILRGARVEVVAATDAGYVLTCANAGPLRADAVILATPAFISAELLKACDPSLANELRAIPYASTATISIAYRLADIARPLDGYGYVVPAAEGRTVLACTWTSTKFAHRAPRGYGLIRVFLGRSGQQRVVQGSDEDLLQLARTEVRDVLGITAPPLLARVFRWPAAMPQYTIGHLDRLAAIEQRLAHHPGLFVAGSAYRGVGIPDCIASGEKAAAQALDFIESRVDTPA